ncbi:putative small nuclear ribonucleoprotein [Ordospora colligata]|uniref:Putative small nuclear ribonucleoprotein n=1 Tax=Ordospora colligata OC4 TaxID=1354746 RepID=A0A0B2UIL8_9MICR|nr:putative small nuclear ribonucleoprotein [Ordospora colligata OC4]KHN69084.1 putative small nuclear ribonucleoprotein [Ordospora colligata OC4]TBU14539.1 putative small nuclear ribonucleoprotein [Ordospora colligata]TBU14733.1 putative small nuclear ribonucleoprotein [Ordospora colligata]TBU18167.1 putative small nuclear ribonucleoprotein [Ordospora colligata]
MEFQALDVLKNSRNKYVKVMTLNNKMYRGMLESFDMHVNTYLKEGYIEAEGSEEVFVGDVLINGGTIAFFDIM